MSIYKRNAFSKFICHVMVIALVTSLFGSFLMINASSSHGYSKVCRVTTSTLNVRKGAGTSYAKVGTLKKGVYKLVLSSQKDKKGTTWYKVYYSGTKSGYISSKYVNIISLPFTSMSSSATIKTSGGNVNLRNGPGTIFTCIGTIANGKKVTLTGKAKDVYGTYWYRFTYNGKTSYVHSKYVSLTSSSSSTSNSSTSGTSGSSNSSSSGSSAAYTFTVGTVTTSSSSLNVRSGPGTGYTKLGTIAKGTVVTITGTATASNGVKWYKYNYSSNKTGYLSSAYVTVKTVQSDKTFESYMTSQGFPDSYKGGLRLLHALHPNWKFVAYDVGCTWSSALSAETKDLGTNLVSSSLPTSYRSTASGSYNSKTKTWTKFDGSWYAASKTVVAYYMDPRNFLNENGVYQFMTHQYDSSSQNETTVKAVIKGTFMETRSTGSSTYKTFASLINAAGKSAGVNPNVIAAMIVQEQGTKGTSGLISGTYTGYKGYYNFFNIGAYTTSTMSAVQRGLWYAKQSGSYGRPWNSIYKSIRGGALFYGTNYVNNKQDTYYYKKFNVKNGVSNIGSHQYMTNVSAAASEGKLLKSAFSSNSSYSAVIDIPVYRNMPEEACPLP